MLCRQGGRDLPRRAKFVFFSQIACLYHEDTAYLIPKFCLGVRDCPSAVSYCACLFCVITTACAHRCMRGLIFACIYETLIVFIVLKQLQPKKDSQTNTHSNRIKPALTYHFNCRFRPPFEINSEICGGCLFVCIASKTN